MKLVTIDTPPTDAGGHAPGRAGAMIAGGEILDIARVRREGSLEAWIPGSVRGILAGGQPGLDAVRRIVDRVEGAAAGELARLREEQALLPATTRLLSPVPDPPMILSLGSAYRSHLEEMKAQPPKNPSGFIKVMAALSGTGAHIVLPPQNPDMVDFEGEFCCVIGTAFHNVTEDEVMQHIAGYTICNDVSARDWVEAAMGPKEPQAAAAGWRLNHLGKQFPGFFPVGPVLLTRDEVPDPPDLQLTTRLNGAVMQSARTSDLIFSVARSISHFSRWYRFSPGDIVTTGSPAGVGYGRNPRVFLKPGDVIAVEIEKIGVLTNTVRAAASI
ncbi:MAG: fumarylacetoacetate hydrolase family protein [Betaproteobacteria bacterium]|nr:fumarylacetoacetate hydrolase family protein [Betaproteobacteria bacterium]